MKVVSGILSALVVCAGTYLKFYRMSRIIDSSQQPMSAMEDPSGHGAGPTLTFTFESPPSNEPRAGSDKIVSSGMQSNPFVD